MTTRAGAVHAAARRRTLGAGRRPAADRRGSDRRTSPGGRNPSAAARSRSTGLRVRGRRPLRSLWPRLPPPRASGRRSSTPTERGAPAPRTTRGSRSNGARSCAGCRPIGGRRSSPRCSTGSRSSWPRSPRCCGPATPAGSRPAPANEPSVLVALGPWPAEASLRLHAQPRRVVGARCGRGLARPTRDARRARRAARAAPHRLSGARRMTRTGCVWCPDWPVIAARRRDEALRGGSRRRARARSARRDVVRAASTEARAEGVTRGMRRREAEARCPGGGVCRRRRSATKRARSRSSRARSRRSRPGSCSNGRVVRVPDARPVALFRRRRRARGARARRGADRARSRRHRRAGRDRRRRVHRPARGPPQRWWCPPGGVGRVPRAVAGVDVRRRRSREPARAARLAHARATSPRCRPTRCSHGSASTVAASTISRAASIPVRRCSSPPPPDLVEQTELDPPAERVDIAAFAAKELADRLLERLAERGLACTRVMIEAETEHGERLARCWRQRRALTPRALAERVRWQLDGWITTGETTAGIAVLRLRARRSRARRRSPTRLLGRRPSRARPRRPRARARAGHARLRRGRDRGACKAVARPPNRCGGCRGANPVSRTGRSSSAPRCARGRVRCPPPFPARVFDPPLAGRARRRRGRRDRGDRPGRADRRARAAAQPGRDRRR